MRLKEKILVFFLAVILSCLGFYLISSPFVALHLSAKEARTETAGSYLAEYHKNISCARDFKDSSLKLICFITSPYYFKILSTLGESE